MKKRNAACERRVKEMAPQDGAGLTEDLGARTGARPGTSCR
jgi:hypothetical protein